MPKLGKFSIWQYQICWRIALTVFLSILLVEVIVLFPTYKNLEREALNRLSKESLSVFSTILNIEKKFSEQEYAQIFTNALVETQVRGATIYNLNGGIHYQFGESSSPAINQSQTSLNWFKTLRVEHGTRYDVIWLQNDLIAPFKIHARLDASGISEALLNHIFNMFCLAVVISLFATAVTTWIVMQILLKPMLKLTSQTLEQRVQERTETLTLSNEKLVEEIKERDRYEKELVKLSNYDVQTELPNRNLFENHLSTTAKELDAGRMCGVCAVELNQFQDVSTAFGHQVSDQFVQAAGEELSSALPKAICIARIRPNQLALLTESVHDILELAKYADKILELFSMPFQIANQSIATSINLGIAVLPQDGEDAAMLLRHANLALHRAQRTQPNSMQFYEANMNALVEQKHNTFVDLHYAVENQEFFLEYQPKLSTKDMQITGFETLIRWQHPKQGKIRPDVFIPIAEESGLIVPMGRWILTEACAQLKCWHNRGHTHLSIAVNISPIQFNQNNFIETVASILEETQLDPKYLELEITESSVLSNFDYVIEVLTGLKKLGLMLSIDDFGTGYSSLSYLKELPVDKLKIDQSFIKTIAPEQKDNAFVDAIIYLCHQLSIKVVAEGVETSFQQEFLISKNCDELQGYFISKPLEAEVAEGFYRGKKD